MEGYAILIDLATQRIGANIFRKIVADIAQRGTIEYIKFYNYNTKRHREFGALIKEYGIDIDATRAGKKRVRIDIRQVIDAVRIASSCANVTTFFIISAELDGEYLFSELKRMGKYIVMGVTSPTTLSSKAHRIYYIDRSLEVEDTPPAQDISSTTPPISSRDESIDAHDEDALYEDVAIACDETVSSSAVKGVDTSIFPYSDIDTADIDEKMREIDRRILDVIQSRRKGNLSKIFGK